MTAEYRSQRTEQHASLLSSSDEEYMYEEQREFFKRYLLDIKQRSMLHIDELN